MIDDSTLRIAALVAAPLVLAGPTVVAAAKKAYGYVSIPGKPAPEAVVDDAHTVVEIARRLRKSGNTKGADLCKQLLDVLLSSEPKA